MNFVFTLLTGLASPILPTTLGWVIWVCYAGWIIFSLYRERRYQPAWKGAQWASFVGLLILVPFTSLFIGVSLPAGTGLPLPGFPADHAPGSYLMLFSAVPWILAGGMLGPLGAAVLGALAGLLRGVWDTYSLFTLLEFALLGVFFSASVRQRYRTPFYRLLRQPLLSALLLIPLHAVLFVVGAFFSLSSSVPAAARLDFGLSHAGVAALAFGGEMLVAGVIAQLAVMVFPTAWGRGLALEPSPAERSLETRFLIGTGAFVFALLFTLLVGDWIVAGRKATDMIRQRMAGTAQSASQAVPFFLETGQNLAVQIASDPRLQSSEDPELSSIVGGFMQAAPFFDQLVVLDVGTGRLLGGYPASAHQDFSASPQEADGLQLAAGGVLTQIYSIPPNNPEDSARASFLIGIPEADGQVRRVLIGRTDLRTNPLIQPLIRNLKNLDDLDGSGMLLDEDGQVVYVHSVSGTPPAYNGNRGDLPEFSTATAPDGTRQLVYYQPVEGRPWAVVLAVPARSAQQLALDIAMPLFVMIILLALLALVSLRLGLRFVTGSLQNLAVEANRIAGGRLDHSLPAGGADEVGQLRGAFEQMRVSLAARLEELNRLLAVSQKVASSLEMQDAVRPVLEAVLSTGASAVRVVLSPSVVPESPVELPSRFAIGPARDAYSHLDDQILAMAQKQDRIVLPNISRARELTLDAGRPQPAALMAVPLRHENRYYGVMWAAYEQARNFNEADLRFATTLAGQGALAVANARLFLNVEVARRQLEGIINSTPDPVLVTDTGQRLLLANRAAGEWLGVDIEQARGRAVEKAIGQKALVDLLRDGAEKGSVEVSMPDGRTYLATASSVVAEGLAVGRVCILRDITHFKELDALKSEFVATVSHDLRSPLTLIRGYATMLDTAGDLNDRQKTYARKIEAGVDTMSRLVNTLLDLGRIELGVGLQVEPCSVVDILEHVTGTLQLQAAQKNIVIEVVLAKDTPNMLEADRALLQQAVYNLVENAIKYTPEDGRVRLSTRADPGSLAFVIEDNGIGIGADDLPHLFEKFYRSKQREARAQHGSGLGLAIVHSIAESHGGRVWVESEPGKGSRFYLQVPLAQPGESAAI